MAALFFSSYVEAPPGKVWGEIRKIESAETLTEMVHKVEIAAPDKRICTLGDGGKIAETIVSLEDSRRRQSYTVTENPFGITHHNAVFEVSETGQGSRLDWTIDMLPDEMAKAMEPVLAKEFRTMVERLASR